MSRLRCDNCATPVVRRMRQRPQLRRPPLCETRLAQRALSRRERHCGRAHEPFLRLLQVPVSATGCLHELSKITFAEDDRFCDECDRDFRRGDQVHSCRQCGYDQCSDCQKSKLQRAAARTSGSDAGLRLMVAKSQMFSPRNQGGAMCSLCDSQLFQRLLQGSQAPDSDKQWVLSQVDVEAVTGRAVLAPAAPETQGSRPCTSSIACKF